MVRSLQCKVTNAWKSQGKGDCNKTGVGPKPAGPKMRKRESEYRGPVRSPLQHSRVGDVLLRDASRNQTRLEQLPHRLVQVRSRDDLIPAGNLDDLQAARPLVVGSQRRERGIDVLAGLVLEQLVEHLGRQRLGRRPAFVLFHLGGFAKGGVAAIGPADDVQTGPVGGLGTLIEIGVTSRLALTLRGGVDAARLDTGWSRAGVLTAGVAIY